MKNGVLSDNLSAESAQDLVKELDVLRDENTQLKQRIRWFEKQVFGPKSEKRLVEDPTQLSLLGGKMATDPIESDKITVTYERGKGKKQRPDDCVNDAGLRFSDDVPVQVVPVIPPELQGDEADQYEIIDTHIRCKLAQRPASYVVLQYEIPILKRKRVADIEADASSDTNATSQPALITPTMPDQVLENSVADVSVLVGLLVDKFCYHLPLYRQHQRMSQAGVTLSRATLTNWSKRAIELLRPIVEAQLRHVLQSKVLAMDETPIKAGRKERGKLKQGYFWPVYGEDHEIVFTYHASRGRQHIEQLIKTSFQGTLLTDGYAAYARYVQHTEGVTHAQCWVHSRRKFVEAESRDPDAADAALAQIAQLYQVEKQLQDKGLIGEKKRDYRLAHSKPVVDAFFEWCQGQCQRTDLTPTDPLTKALNYVRNREPSLRVFLEDPDVQPDTNHLEREIRPIPMGRKNWLFCWTEIGAEHVGIIQSLISTCKLHGVNPYTYFTDVLQRISNHPASRVEELTPRLWKDLYANQPMRSVLDRESNNVGE